MKVRVLIQRGVRMSRFARDSGFCSLPSGSPSSLLRHHQYPERPRHRPPTSATRALVWHRQVRRRQINNLAGGLTAIVRAPTYSALYKDPHLHPLPSRERIQNALSSSDLDAARVEPPLD